LLVARAPAHATAPCADILFSSQDLEHILDLVLGSWRSLVRDRSVTIEPADASCYVHIQLTAELLPGMNCELQACSVTVFHDQKIGLREFDVEGCEVIFNLVPVSRHVPTALADARPQIAAHCTSPSFVIAGVAPEVSEAGPRVRIKLRSAP
jgi:hypothetical protein